jgi:hypothetical protein
MSDSHVDRDRPCGSKADHVPHPWDMGRRQCHGYGKYAADRQPRPIVSDELCERTWTGPTGIVWDCTGPKHYSDPNAGYCGSGHTMVPRPRLGLDD